MFIPLRNCGTLSSAPVALWQFTEAAARSGGTALAGCTSRDRGGPGMELVRLLLCRALRKMTLYGAVRQGRFADVPPQLPPVSTMYIPTAHRRIAVYR